jgi:UDP-N-acetylmuramyl tripeptide synthase
MVDRRAAIRATPSSMPANAEDIVVLAGKGHEDYQEDPRRETPVLRFRRGPPGAGRERCLQLNRRESACNCMRPPASPERCQAVGADVEISVRRPPIPATCTAGCLFVALKGPRFDGHSLRREGAGSRRRRRDGGTPRATWRSAPPWWWTTPCLALGRLAAWHRANMPARMAAITGSNGKTTVKEMVAAILAAEVGAEAGAEAVLATRRQPEQRHRHAADPVAACARRTATR